MFLGRRRKLHHYPRGFFKTNSSKESLHTHTLNENLVNMNISYGNSYVMIYLSVVDHDWLCCGHYGQNDFDQMSQIRMISVYLFF